MSTFYDRVQETTVSTGTGTLTLLGAATNYQAFSVAGNGAVVPYTIIDSTNNVWETGTGTYTLSGTTLSRDTILANSSGTTVALNLGSGTKTVILALPAELTSLDLPATLTTPTQNQSVQGNAVAIVEADSYVLPPGFVCTLNSGSVLLLNPPMYPVGNYTPYNYLINGGWDFAQRQAPATLTNVAPIDSYTADRWKAAWQTNNLQYARVDTSTAPETGVYSRYYGQYKQITGAGKFAPYQIVESFNSSPLNYQQVTFQVKMKASSAKTIRLGILAWTGATDTITNSIVSSWNSNSVDPTWVTNLAIVGSAVSCSVTTTWQVFSVTVNIPGGVDNVIPIFWTDSQFSANDILDVAECGLYMAAGKVLPWQPRPYQQELALCHRYYEKSFDVDQAPIQALGSFTGALVNNEQVSGTNSFGQAFFQASKPSAGVVTTYNPSTAANTWRDIGNSTTAAVINTQIGTKTLTLGVSAAAVLRWFIHWSVDADL